MKVAITSAGTTLASPMDPRFGRAQYYLIVDTDIGKFKVHDNSCNAQAATGAGIQAGKTIVDLGVKALITGNMGPKALEVLQAGGVDVYAGVTGTAQDALRAFEAGKLEPILRPNVQGHWAPAHS